MADQPAYRLVEPAATPRHYTPPSARELRSQSIHRFQIGVFGLCAMLLLVSLANVIMDRALRSEETDAATEKVIATDAAPEKVATDPLADIGVVPSADPEPEARAAGEADDPLATQ